MIKKNLSEQLDLVRRDSCSEFVEYTNEFTLKSKAVAELYKPRIYLGVEKFEAYIRRHGQLDPVDERKLLETHRRDLQAIYFSYCECHDNNELLIVRNPELSKLYFKYGHCPGKSAQQALIRGKTKNIYCFIKIFSFCDEVLADFMHHADKKLKNCYVRLHPKGIMAF
ncbi:MAG: hypothetical protein IJ689_02550 [Alphaproteobacteria bacterium]|nr:hypothetical protein [Alphaproteobacteria bacterium]